MVVNMPMTANAKPANANRTVRRSRAARRSRRPSMDSMAAANVCDLPAQVGAERRHLAAQLRHPAAQLAAQLAHFAAQLRPFRRATPPSRRATRCRVAPRRSWWPVAPSRAGGARSVRRPFRCPCVQRSCGAAPRSSRRSRSSSLPAGLGLPVAVPPAGRDGLGVRAMRVPRQSGADITPTERTISSNATNGGGGEHNSQRGGRIRGRAVSRRRGRRTPGRSRTCP